MKHKIIVIILALLASPLVNAQCEKYLKNWAIELPSKGDVDLTIAACKIWPNDPTLTIAALPFPHKNNDSETGAYDLEVLVADSMTGAVVARTYQPSAISYDAIRLTGISIDTGRYQLTPNKRAFGIRINHSGSSNIFPYDTTTLSLYVIEGKLLRAVLDRFVVGTRNGDWDGICDGTFSTKSRSIDIGKPGIDGFATLKVIEQNTRSISKLSDGECVTQDSRQQPTNFSLAYRNGSYQTPKKMTLEF